MDISLIIGCVAGAAIVVGIVAVRKWWRRGQAARKGKRGEKQVSKVLAHLKKKDFVVFNDLLIPSSGGNTSQIDHIIVSTRGIFIIETKSHLGRISGSEHAQYWEQRLAGQSRNFYNPFLQNSSHIKALRKLLPMIPEEAFISVVVFSEATGLNIKADNVIIKRRLLPDKIIRRTLVPSERMGKSWWRGDKEVRLDESKIVLLLDDLTEELKRRKKIFSREEIGDISKIIEGNIVQGRGVRKEHISFVKSIAKKANREIHNGICPRCGGQLVVRKTENGEFLGCENFPRCKFSSRLEN